MLHFKRYFAIIAISFIAFSCQNVRERFTPTPLEPYVSKLSVKINGEAIANATTITSSVMVGTNAAGEATDVLVIKGVVSGKNVELRIQPALGVGSTVRNIDGINNGLIYTDGAATYTPIAARSTMLVGYLDTKLKVIRGEFEARLTQVGGAGEVQLSQCTFDIQY